MSSQTGENRKTELTNLLPPLSSSATAVAAERQYKYQSTAVAEIRNSLDDDDDDLSSSSSQANSYLSFESAADKLSSRLVACKDNDEMEGIVLSNSFCLNNNDHDGALTRELNARKLPHLKHHHRQITSRRHKEGFDKPMLKRFMVMFSLAMLGIMIMIILLQIGAVIVGPPSQPIGAYKLVEIQEGNNFFNHYSFYNGADSEGSNGFISYVGREEATQLNIANVTYENNETFIYMSTAPTEDGPRKSVRLEGLTRFNRGLFILDVRHMPAGCASWPAFWLTDEPNWPVNGEIDILEGVNNQTNVKTALHTTMDCKMNDVPLGVKTGYWDTAVGVPKKNGDLDMTIREATDCYVYDPHQWLNQGCVAMSDQKGTIGEPLNQKGGGVFALEWDPINRHIRSFVFAPHTKVPENLKLALKTASESDPSKRISPDTRLWGLPYAYFSIGDSTQCSAEHFRNMHIIFNMALCGSVAGNRFYKDCPLLNEKYGSCENYVGNNTSAMDEIYWKVRGVYVYEREWERAWVN